MRIKVLLQQQTAVCQGGSNQLYLDSRASSVTLIEALTPNLFRKISQFPPISVLFLSHYWDHVHRTPFQKFQPVASAELGFAFLSSYKPHRACPARDLSPDDHVVLVVARRIVEKRHGDVLQVQVVGAGVELRALLAFVHVFYQKEEPVVCSCWCSENTT